MGATVCDRISGALPRAACCVLLGALAACATGNTATPDPRAEAAVLSEIAVHQDLGRAVVTLEGVGRAGFDAFEESAVGRLSFELSPVRAEGVPESVSLVDGMVEEVRVSSTTAPDGSPSTRVELRVAPGFQYDVIPYGETLEVRLTAAGRGEAEEAQAAGGAAEPPGFDEPLAGGALDPAEAPSASESAKPAPRATLLLDVRPSGESEDTHVRLAADGRFEGVETFVLEKPSRLVIDLPGVGTVVPARIPVESHHVKAVRVGRHEGKVRVVLDGTDVEAPFGAHRLVHADDGVVVELGPGVAALAASEPVAPPAEAAGAALEEPESTETALQEPLDEEEAGSAQAPTQPAPAARRLPAASASTSRVTAVDFESRLDRMSVRVQVSGRASYQLFEPDPQTVVLSLPDAILDPTAEARIAPEPGGPISLVMAFQQPDVPRPEVRVVIKRGTALTPHVERQGSTLVVEFEKGRVSAVPPPVLRPDPLTPEATAAPPEPPASTAPAKALASATAPAAPAPPAALSDASGIEILREGGLLDGKQYVGRRISLDFKDVDIDDVLRLIAEVSDLNVIAAENVQGKVTIRLIDVPWDQALDVILLTKGLGFVKVGNVLRIAPNNVLKQETESRLQERRAREKLEDLIVKFQPVNYAKVNNVQAMVKRLLTPRGTVNTDTRTNTVIIKDIPSVIDEAVALIKAIDTPTPQVLIEAKIVEANLDFTRELGTVWGLGVQRFNDGFSSGSGTKQTVGSEDVRFKPDPSLLTGVTELNNFVVSNPITALPTALFSAGAFLLDQQFNVELQLQATEAAGEGKVISSPRVVTLDNREAVIEQGVAIPFQTFENGDAQLEFVDAVLQLKVRPHITADRSIIMALEVSRNAPDDSVAAPGGAPAIAKNQAKTETLVADGQTLVIGGIYTIQKSDRMSRVPYLHRIPIIGLAFRNKLVRDLRKELLIFVTPRIVEMPQLGT